MLTNESASPGGTTQDNDRGTPHALSYTLKIMFGPMYGSELYLPAEDYLLVIASNKDLMIDASSDPDGSEKKQHVCSYVQNTLFIPADVDMPNMVLHLSQKPVPLNDENSEQLPVTIYDGKDMLNEAITLQTYFQYQNIRLALKKADDSWAHEALIASQLDADKDESTSTESLSIIPRLAVKYNRRIFLYGLLLSLTMVISAAIFYQHYQSTHKIMSLSQRLAGAPSPVLILQGRDDNIYALATHYRDLQWLQAALIKLPDQKNIKALWKDNVRTDILLQLQQSGIPVLQLDLSSPQYPTLRILQGVNSARIKDLQQLLLKKMPYARHIYLHQYSKKTILESAENGLKRLQIPYHQINTVQGYTFEIHNQLSDEALTDLQNFIAQFYVLWGNHFINFSINQDENWLQGKSYLDAPNGYLFVDRHHWYFPPAYAF
ncbi:PrgH/EprH family type III secretion apparatus protein [Enterobacter sp. 22466]|uniref:PrgH/EprH family type III secretion apparatus protein n=1 Tax=Enterobacter sp. 22466 TaxID=3453924 RepID=UPI003F830D47